MGRRCTFFGGREMEATYEYVRPIRRDGARDKWILRGEISRGLEGVVAANPSCCWRSVFKVLEDRQICIYKYASEVKSDAYQNL